jgi:L-asparaginase II
MSPIDKSVAMPVAPVAGQAVDSPPVPVVVAEVVRGGFVEGQHCGSLIALAADGSVVLSAGRPDAPMLPRSSAKPLQAAGMLHAGLDIDGELLAIACASHSGEDRHVDVVRRLLQHAGLDESALDNTPGMPTDAATRRAMTRAGEGPNRIRQNCSGKHAAMLATCVAAGWPTAGYREPSHPLQRSLRAAISELTGDEVTAAVVDGCGAALFAITLSGLARSFARLATADPSSPEGRCYAAMRAYPDLVGGRGRDVTRLIGEVPGLIAKDGAEGVYAAALPDGRAVAVKIDDGAERARLPVLAAAFRALGIEAPVIDELSTTAVLGHGDRVGEVRTTL